MKKTLVFITALFSITVVLFQPIIALSDEKIDSTVTIDTETLPTIDLSTGITPYANMTPTEVYVGTVLLPFTGANPPGTMFYKLARYGRQYRGYLTRDYKGQLIWGTSNNYAAYKGTLYRDDLPYPSTRSIDIPEEIQTSITPFATKTIYHTVTFRKGTTIPDYYWYNDGQWRGNLKLDSWKDYSEHPTIKGYVCTYKGTVSNTSAPGTKKVAEDILE